jgi:hypothetical protein
MYPSAVDDSGRAKASPPKVGHAQTGQKGAGKPKAPAANREKGKR